MKKVTLYIIISCISFIAFAQHVEYYPTSQRYYMEPYHKPNVLNYYDSIMSSYPFLTNHYYYYDSPDSNSFFHRYHRYYPPNQAESQGNYRMANKCIVANMSGRAIYGIAVPVGLWTVPRDNNGCHNIEHLALISDSVSEETGSYFDSAWNEMIYILQQRTELYPWYQMRMWLLRPTGSETNQSWLIDSVSAIPEWNMITDSKFRFPNLWLDDSIHESFSNEPYLTFPTLEVYFEQPYIVSDSFIVAGDCDYTFMFFCNDTFCRGLDPLHIRTSYAENHFSGWINLLDGYGYPHYTDHYMTNPYDSVYTSLTWKGIFPILVPPSGCYKPYDVRASVIGYDSAVVEWMSRFWLPESRVEYGPAGFAPDSGTAIYGVTGNKITLHGLSENTDYEVRVSNWCSDDSAYSEQSVTTFRTAPRCEPAGEISLFVASDTTIQLAWSLPDSAAWCEVEWGPEGFNEGEGTLLPHVNPGYMGGYLFLQHLQPATSYDVRVRNWCPHSQAFSPWREYNVATKGRYTISVASNNDSWGHVTGAGVYLEGERAMLNAIPASEVCHFRKWLDGDISNPRFVEVSADSLFTAIFINDTVPLSVSAPSSPHSLTLRPNPTSGMVEISARESLSSIDLYDISGRPVLHFEPLSPSASLDLSLLAPGLYTLRATTQGGIVYTDKLLVTRL